MKIQLTDGGRTFAVDASSGRSIAIDLHFSGDQPNHFGVPLAKQSTVEIAGFIGDTRRGGSCNVDELKLIPHCNGTHTETVGHIIHDAVPISGLKIPLLMMAALVSVTPDVIADSAESYRPKFEDDDLVITATSLRANLGMSGVRNDFTALIVRTLPNSESKKTSVYDGVDCAPPYLTNEAIDYINEMGVQHLLVDVPSIDRIHDEGVLSNHHLYWNVAAEQRELSDAVAVHKTISEMIFVPHDIEDGNYLLNLQMPEFSTTAVPSKPVIYKIEEIHESN